MADTQTTTKKIGLTRGKAILIGALGVALVGVLYLQFGRGGGSSSPDPRARGSRRNPVAQAATPVEKKSDSKASAQPEQTAAVAMVVGGARWKSPDLAKVVDYDPFALPESFPKPKALDPTGPANEGLVAAAAADEAKKLSDAIAQLQLQLNELREGGVQVIVRERDQYVAMIGDRTLHVGDEIKGFKVTQIDPNGVVVERKE